MKTVDLGFPSPLTSRPLPGGLVTGLPRTQRYFPETGHTVAFGFKHYWEEKHGSVRILGLPISEEFQEGDTPSSTSSGLASNITREFAGTGTRSCWACWALRYPRVGLRHVSPSRRTRTGSISGDRQLPSEPFLSYWLDNGGLAVFGFPISEPFRRVDFLVQYFEQELLRDTIRNSPDRRLSALLGPGDDMARLRGYLP